MSDSPPSFLEVLNLEEIDTNLYRSTHTYEANRPLFGGQVIAQAMLAASASTEPDRTVHSIHCYFLRAGDSSRPVTFYVDADFDGGSFSSRRVVARQRGQVIFNASMSFHRGANGPTHQMTKRPELPPIDDTHPWPSAMMNGLQIRTPEPFRVPGRPPPRLYTRFDGDFPDSPNMHLAALAYLSDISSGLADLMTPEIDYLSTIDHSVWFHHVPDMTQWNLFHLEPRATGDGRGFFLGSVFDPNGNLIASVTQESLFRYQRGKGPQQPA